MLDHVQPNAQTGAMGLDKIMIVETGSQNMANHTQKEEEIGTRPNGQMLACHLRGLGEAWIDNHQLAAARTDRAQLLFHMRSALQQGHALGGIGVGTQKQREVSASGIRLQNIIFVAQDAMRHRAAVGIFERQNVERIGRTKSVAKRVGEQDRRRVGGVAPIGRNCGRAMFVRQCTQPLADILGGGVPIDPLPAGGGFALGVN